jgi:signal peptidase I
MLMIRRVVGPSMQPTLSSGELVLGLRWRRARVGSIVIADVNGREIIKRVAKIGERGIYLLGDNLTYSTDSRAYGWLTSSAIKGVIIGSIKR